jgi:hypothetical protein
MNEVHVGTHADLKDIPMCQRDDAPPNLLDRFRISQHAYEIGIDMILVERHSCLMLVHKCDNCKKEIKSRDKEIIAGFAWPQFSFCGRCGKPIIAFLKKRKLLQPKTTG